MKKWLIRVLLALIVSGFIINQLMDEKEEKITFLYADF